MGKEVLALQENYIHHLNSEHGTFFTLSSHTTLCISMDSCIFQECSMETSFGNIHILPLEREAVPFDPQHSGAQKLNIWQITLIHSLKFVQISLKVVATLEFFFF